MKNLKQQIIDKTYQIEDITDQMNDVFNKNPNDTICFNYRRF